MADRKQDFGAGAEAHDRFKQYDYRAVSAYAGPAAEQRGHAGRGEQGARRAL